MMILSHFEDSSISCQYVEDPGEKKIIERNKWKTTRDGDLMVTHRKIS